LICWKDGPLINVDRVPSESIKQQLADIQAIVEMLKNNGESVKEALCALEDDNVDVSPPEYALTERITRPPSYRASDSGSAERQYPM